LFYKSILNNVYTTDIHCDIKTPYPYIDKENIYYKKIIGCSSIRVLIQVKLVTNRDVRKFLDVYSTS